MEVKMGRAECGFGFVAAGSGILRMRSGVRQRRTRRTAATDQRVRVSMSSAGVSEAGPTESEPDTRAQAPAVVDHLEQPGFVATRYRVFIGLYLSYVVYSLTRATFTFIAPTLRQSGVLSLYDIGVVTSLFPIMYGCSKLVSGFVADNASPRVVLGSGMILTGLANIGMTFARTVAGFGAAWGLNGLVQGVGAGAVARMLTSWFTRTERGFWWALWSTSANFGGFLAPLVCGSLVANYGWMAGAAVPGILAVVLGVAMIPILQDRPEDSGYFVGAPPASKAVETEAKNGDTAAQARPRANEEPDGFWQAFVSKVLFNRSLWLLALSNLFIYYLRSGMRSWHHFYLADLRQITTAEAAYRVSGIELGGLVGTLSSGVLSDKIGGSRVPVICAYLTGLAATLAFVLVSPVNLYAVDAIAVALLGFFINGPQCLIGLVAAETVDPRTVATATGILGWVSYLGASMSGLPISICVRRFGWSAYVGMLLASSVAAGLALLPLWRQSSAAHKGPSET